MDATAPIANTIGTAMIIDPLAGTTTGIQQDQDHCQETRATSHEVYQETGTATAVARCHVKEIARDIIHRSGEDSALDVAAEITSYLTTFAMSPYEK